MEAVRDLDYRRKVKELGVLHSISGILDSSDDVQHVLMPILKILSEEMGMERGTVCLLNRLTDEIQIEAAHGLTEEQLRMGRYAMDEGIVGRVIGSGRAAVVPRISEEPSFLDRTGARKDIMRSRTAYICVPIRIESLIIGALSIDRSYSGNSFDEKLFDDDLRLLTIIGSMIAQAVKVRRRVQEEKDRSRQLESRLKDSCSSSNMIGKSSSMREVFLLVDQVCGSNATVLVRGESGTGKELVAHAIHYNSPRAHGPFVKVNCAALPESVIESELFGHEKGAFTSAVATRKGRFELANGGTIFLDEIGDLSMLMQVKLLRVLQEREFERVGGTETIKTNVRVVAATNRPLEEMLADGRFREDLYYRLNVFPVNIPPLRDRKSDIVLLADHFAEKYGRANGKPVKRISTPAIEMLMSYHWPGNVRELENCIERAVLLADDGVIHGHLLPPSLQTAEATGSGLGTGLQDKLGMLECELLKDSLKSSRGNMASAARALGITERQMGLRVKRYGIEPERYR